ncbi:MAG: hypothetical protein NVS2B12_09380 [Ktedonobacteraceae bacterium]
MQTAELMALPQSKFSPFHAQQLVLVHLPDASRNYALIPVPGVVIRADLNEATVRVRNLAGSIVNVTVSNNDLIAR